MRGPDTLDDPILATFDEEFRGDAFRPGDERYDDARTVWNAAVDREPALVARCTGTADVVTAVDVAREHDLPLAVRATGHNVAGTAVRDGGIVIDVRSIDGIRVDPLEEAGAVLRRYRDWMADAPDEVTTLASVLELPSAPHVPAERHGSRAVMIGVCYAGDLNRGERVLAPLRESGDPFVDTVRRRPYTEWQRAGESDAVLRTHQTSCYLGGLSDGAVDTFVERVTDAPPGAAAYFLAHDGAVTDVSRDATAYPHRDASYLLVVEARWEDPDQDDRYVTWVRECREAMRPHATGGMWVNALTEHGNRGHVSAAYGDNYDRLVDVKTEWDPENRFRTNHNVEPGR